MARKKKAAPETAQSPPSSAEVDSWRAEEDLRTLKRAAEIAADKKRMRLAQAEAKKQMKALHRVAGGKMGGGMSRRKRLESVEL